jgi:hypothetical protein
LSEAQSLLNRGLVRLRKITNFGRTSYPYISGDAFVRLANFAIQKSEDFHIPRDALDANVVFIKADLLKPFLEAGMLGLRPKVLISGNGDTNFSEPIHLDECVQLLLCQNSLIPDYANILTIPIGLENRSLGRSGNPNYFKHKAHRNLGRGRVSLLVPPMSPTNPVRKSVLDEISSIDSDCLVVVESLLSTKEYFDLVREFRFILCLEGNGFDTHRVWESLYLESFPVMIKSPWSDLLVKSGFPILVVSTVGEINERLLIDFESSHQDFCSKNLDMLWMPHWERLILQACTRVA